MNLLTEKQVAVRQEFPLGQHGFFPFLDSTHIPKNFFTSLSTLPYTEHRQRANFLQRYPESQLIVHFYLDDYRFNVVWNSPSKPFTLNNTLCHPNIYLLTPDFSVYEDFSVARMFSEIYKSRWCGAYWSTLGCNVIPTLTWTTPLIETFFFDIAQYSPVCIAAPSSSRKRGQQTNLDLYYQGVQKIKDYINPSYILVYGMTDKHTELEQQLHYLQLDYIPINQPNRF